MINFNNLCCFCNNNDIKLKNWTAVQHFFWEFSLKKKKRYETKVYIQLNYFLLSLFLMNLMAWYIGHTFRCWERGLLWPLVAVVCFTEEGHSAGSKLCERGGGGFPVPGHSWHWFWWTGEDKEETGACGGGIWLRHQMETFSVLLAFCAGNSLVTGEFPSQRPVMRSFDVFFDLRLNKMVE